MKTKERRLGLSFEVLVGATTSLWCCDQRLAHLEEHRPSSAAKVSLAIASRDPVIDIAAHRCPTSDEVTALRNVVATAW